MMCLTYDWETSTKWDAFLILQFKSNSPKWSLFWKSYFLLQEEMLHYAGLQKLMYIMNGVDNLVGGAKHFLKWAWAFKTVKKGSQKLSCIPNAVTLTNSVTTPGRMSTSNQCSALIWVHREECCYLWTWPLGIMLLTSLYLLVKASLYASFRQANKAHQINYIWKTVEDGRERWRMKIYAADLCIFQ